MAGVGVGWAVSLFSIFLLIWIILVTTPVLHPHQTFLDSYPAFFLVTFTKNQYIFHYSCLDITTLQIFYFTSIVYHSINFFYQTKFISFLLQACFLYHNSILFLAKANLYQKALVFFFANYTPCFHIIFPIEIVFLGCTFL